MTSNNSASLLSIADRLASLYEYLRRETPSVTSTVRGDVEVGRDEYEVDAGELGTSYISISFTEYDVEVEGEVEVDLDEIISDGPVSTSDLDSIVDEIKAIAAEPEAGASVPRAIGDAERNVGRALLAAGRAFFADDSDALRRAIGEALVESGYVVASTLSYDPLTVEVEPQRYDSFYCDTSELRLGDDITGETFGRLVKVERGDYDDSVRVTLNRDGRERSYDWTLRSSWNVLPIKPVEGRENVRPAVEALGVAVEA
jgi:hypothetical protein